MVGAGVSKRLILVLGLFVLPLLASKAQANTHDLVAAEVASYIHLPNYEIHRDSESFTSWDYYRQVCHQTIDDLDPEIKNPVKKVGEKLQMALFGKLSFKLKLCFVAGVVTDLQEQTIYFDTAFITKLVVSLPQDKLEPVLAAIIGHELGHYLYEQILTEKNPPQTALGHRDSWFASSVLNNPNERYLIHGEIDAIGLNIAERAGYDGQLASDALDRVENILNGKTISGKSTRQSVVDAYLLP